VAAGLADCCAFFGLAGCRQHPAEPTIRRTNMNKRMLTLAVATLAAAPFVASAQQSTQPVYKQNPAAMPCAMHAMMMGPMMGGQMSGMMGREMTDSSMMADMRTQLSLTDAQMKQLQAIHQRVCAAAQPHIQLAMQAHQAAMQALAADNLTAYKDQLENAARHMVAAQVEMAKGMIEFHKSLTPEQRQKMEQMHQRMMRGR
jgi:Spy/CpxP family protein refolding chaperone